MLRVQHGLAGASAHQSHSGRDPGMWVSILTCISTVGAAGGRQCWSILYWLLKVTFIFSAHRTTPHFKAAQKGNLTRVQEEENPSIFSTTQCAHLSYWTSDIPCTLFAMLKVPSLLLPRGDHPNHQGQCRSLGKGQSSQYQVPLRLLLIWKQTKKQMIWSPHT